MFIIATKQINSWWCWWAVAIACGFVCFALHEAHVYAAAIAAPAGTHAPVCNLAGCVMQTENVPVVPFWVVTGTATDFARAVVSDPQEKILAALKELYPWTTGKLVVSTAGVYCYTVSFVA